MCVDSIPPMFRGLPDKAAGCVQKIHCIFDIRGGAQKIIQRKGQVKGVNPIKTINVIYECSLNSNWIGLIRDSGFFVLAAELRVLLRS